MVKAATERAREADSAKTQKKENEQPWLAQ